MWSSFKSTLKSAASEIVREAEEREKREKDLLENISGEVQVAPAESAISFFDSQPAQARSQSYAAPTSEPFQEDSSAEAINFFTPKPPRSAAPYEESMPPAAPPPAFSASENDPVQPETGRNGHHRPPALNEEDQALDSIDLFEPEQSQQGQLDYGYAERSGAIHEELSQREPRIERMLSSPSSDRIDFDPTELEQVDLGTPRDPEGFEQHGRVAQAEKPSESPLSQAMRGTFQHLNKLKAMTTSAMSSTLPLQALQEAPLEPAEANPRLNPNVSFKPPQEPVNNSQREHQLIENMRKAKELLAVSSEGANEEFLEQLDEDVMALWQSKRRDLSRPKPWAKENEHANSLNIQQLTRQHEEERGKLREQLRSAHAEVATLRQAQADLQQKLQEAEAQATAATTDNQLLQRRTVEQGTELEALRHQVMKGQQQVAKAEEQGGANTAQWQERLSAMEEECKAAREQVDKLTTANETLEKQLDLKLKLADDETEALFKQSHEELTALKGEESNVQKELLALRARISQRRFEKEAVDKEIGSFSAAVKSVRQTLDELKAVEAALSEESRKNVESEAEVVKEVFNENVAKALEAGVAGKSGLEQARRYSELANTLQRALVDALSARLKQKSAFGCMVSSDVVKDEAGSVVSTVEHPLDLARNAARVLRTLSIEGVALEDILSRLDLLESETADPQSKMSPKSIEELERLAQEVSTISVGKFGRRGEENADEVEVRNEVWARKEGGSKGSSVEEIVDRSSRILAKQHRICGALDKSLKNSVRGTLELAAVMLAAAGRWASELEAVSQKVESAENEAESNDMCDRRLAANVVTICIERNCRRDCLEVVANVLEFNADQRKRVGLDSEGGFWSAFIPNLSRGQAKAEQVNMQEQSLSSLLQDFVIDETS